MASSFQVSGVSLRVKTCLSPSPVTRGMRIPVGSTSTGPTRNDGDSLVSVSWNQSRARASDLRGSTPLVACTFPPGAINNVRRTVCSGRTATDDSAAM